jgi:hypothetical protein
MLRNRRHCAPCRNRSSAAKRTGRGRSPACAGAGSADAGRAEGRGDRRSSGGAHQHGAQLARLLCAWSDSGAAAAPEARTAGQDRAACRGDRGGDPERRHAPRWRPGRRLDAGAAVCRDCPARRADDLAAVALAPAAPKGLCGRPPRVKSAFESELPCRLRVCVRPVRAATWPLAQMGVRLPKLPFRLRAERASLWHGLSPGVVRPTVHALLRLGLSEAALCR